MSDSVTKSDLTTVDGVITHMRTAAGYKTRGERTDAWNERCDEVKAANGGGYPAFWFHTMILSGLADEIVGAGSSDIAILTPYKLQP